MLAKATRVAYLPTYIYCAEGHSGWEIGLGHTGYRSLSHTHTHTHTDTHTHTHTDTHTISLPLLSLAVQQAPVCADRPDQPLTQRRSAGVGGHPSDLRQVPREEGGAQGALRQGTAKRFLPHQVLGQFQTAHTHTHTHTHTTTISHHERHLHPRHTQTPTHPHTHTHSYAHRHTYIHIHTQTPLHTQTHKQIAM